MIADEKLRVASKQLEDQMVKLRDERIAEMQEMERRLKAIEEDLAVMEKTDLSENAPYQVAKDEQSVTVHVLTLLRKRIESLSNELSSYTPTGVIGLGTTVELTLTAIDGVPPKNVSKTHYIVKLVGHDTCDALHGLVAIDSRVGSTIVGHTANEEVTVTTARGQCTYRIGGIY